LIARQHSKLASSAEDILEELSLISATATNLPLSPDGETGFKKINPDDLGEKQIMILRNHGLLTTGSTVADAFMKLYTLESACQVQLMARACNEEYQYVPENILERHARDLKNAGDDSSYRLAFRALVRRMLKKDSSFIL
jgi:ribulose-5-phosphate 4-epimerase/fuculose-1-phosphate aldolase